jgi:hypothetical protein
MQRWACANRVCLRRTWSAISRSGGLEEDAYDRDCDHLVVIDHNHANDARRGTYTLLREEVAARIGGFYSAGEYDLAPLLACGRGAGGAAQLLELGRSCVDPAYRTNATISLLGGRSRRTWNSTGLASCSAAHRSQAPILARYATSWLIFTGSTSRQAT